MGGCSARAALSIEHLPTNTIFKLGKDWTLFKPSSHGLAPLNTCAVQQFIDKNQGWIHTGGLLNIFDNFRLVMASFWLALELMGIERGSVNYC